VSRRIFITGIGTGVGKTVVAAILAEAMQADYWKPIQTGYDDGTDAEFVRSVLSNDSSRILPESYKLKLPASPHIAAAEEGVSLSLDKINGDFQQIKSNRSMIIEGAGGLLVPLNEHEFVTDLIKRLSAEVILVSRNYLGSINHSLLTASVCRHHRIPVMGWIFTDQYLSYEEDIVKWSGYPKLASIGKLKTIDKASVLNEAIRLRGEMPAILS
jgi:dethiobiotin synthetase